MHEEETKDIVPDAVFKAALPASNLLFCAEITNGDKWQTDKGKILRYIEAMHRDVKAIEKTFNYPRAARVLFVYEKQAPMLKLMDWARDAKPLKKSGYAERFLFSTMDDIKNTDFETALLSL